MKKLMLILIAIMLMSCSQSTPKGKQIYPKTIDYEMPYEDTSFKIKKIEFFYDEYNYAYIHYVRLWLDLSKMDNKTLRWFLEGFNKDTKIVPLIDLYNYPNYFSIYTIPNLQLVYKDYDEEKKELFYVYAGKAEKTKITSFEFNFMLKAGSYYNNKDDYGNYYDHYNYEFSDDKIPFEYYDLSNEQEIKTALRKLNSLEY